MTQHGELVIERDKKEIERKRTEPGPLTVLQIIEKISSTPNLTMESVKALETLVGLQREQEAQQRKERFWEAVSRVQKQAKPIHKNGLMDRGPGKGAIAYAKYEDVDAVMRPIYQAEGFSVTWDAPPSPDGKIRVVGEFTAYGHSEKREWSCSPDASGGKQSPQAVGSTVSYGKRYLSIMFWNVVTEGEDTNGAKREDTEPITQDQADTIRTRMNDLPQSKPGNLLGKLCQKHGVEKPEAIRKSQYKDVIADVEATERRFAQR